MGTNIAEPEAKPSFEKSWELLQETLRGLAEMREAMEQQRKEADRRREDADKRREDLERQMKETDKRVGRITNRFGEIAEHMIVPNLVRSFNALGFTFDKSNPDTIVTDFEHNIFTEADAFLENGDCVMVVEIKTKLRTDHVDDHVTRMEKFRARADLHNDKRKYYGAMAALLMSASEKTYALRKGFYVLEPVGETFSITVPAGIGGPKAW
jgi:hypothetical protein